MKSLVLALCAVVFSPVAAQAADFTGKIKRVRIKKRKVGNGQYHAIVQTGSAGAAAAAAGVRVAMAPLDEGGAAPEPIMIDAPASTRFTAIGDASARASEGEAQLALRLISTAGAPLGGPIVVAVPLGDAPVAFDWAQGTGKIAVVPGDKGVRITANVSSREWGDQALGKVAVQVLNPKESPISASEATLSVTEATRRWVADVGVNLDGARYQVTAEVLGDAGEVVKREVVMRAAEAAPGPVSLVKVVPARNGDYKVVAWSRFEGEGAVSVAVQSPEGEPLNTRRTRVADSFAVFSQSGLTFHDDPTNFTYALQFSFYNAAGELLGEQGVEAVAHAAEAGVIQSYTGPANEAVSLRKFFLAIDGEQQGTIALSLDGAQAQAVSQVVIGFEEPFEGPEPDEIELSLARQTTWVKTRQTFSTGGEPLNAPVTVTVATDGPGEGEDGSITFAATAGVSGFGRGTKKSTTKTATLLPALQ